MIKAYIIIAHKAPAQLHRLISRLNDGKSEFFIHIDKKADLKQFDNLNDFGNSLHFLERFDSKWGSLGAIQPFLSGLIAIKDSETEFDRIMLLSGQDYPIKSNDEIDEFFVSSPYSVFINYFPIPNYERWPGSDRGGLYRVDKYYFGLEWYELFSSRFLNLVSAYVPFLRREIPNGMKPFTGQTWWNLDTYALNYILNYVAQHPEYLHFHKNTFVADEVFVQMIIGNSTDERLLNSIENSEKRFTIWEKVSNPHPVILKVTDFMAIASSDDLFARKFDETVDSEILDLIDAKILVATTTGMGKFNHREKENAPGKPSF
ncbi:beta-1,6-N-acetylglucosaminyltransferase [Mucilaginibacter sp. RB4R14]|uniref:beta-1,6-N-acetylglucosaminyltransferase n=1 Tax=Mucilaginibacter aurantiaciroseus TaxID=2949308 RepID=UPI00209084D9|nr:beta-1,6-N-acetylglucosaminyltransferase [Mucilaginibacter aurantiaciroseus]MCO5934670.1 beta-1,6-N-acetylglucosaminyltransferase [Mucilaginibacter aurantiaciroseus]